MDKASFKAGPSRETFNTQPAPRIHDHRNEYHQHDSAANKHALRYDADVMIQAHADNL